MFIYSPARVGGYHKKGTNLLDGYLHLRSNILLHLTNSVKKTHFLGKSLFYCRWLLLYFVVRGFFSRFDYVVYFPWNWVNNFLVRQDSRRNEWMKHLISLTRIPLLLLLMLPYQFAKIWYLACKMSTSLWRRIPSYIVCQTSLEKLQKCQNCKPLIYCNKCYFVECMYLPIWVHVYAFALV